MANDFILLTDSSCDLKKEYLEENNIGAMQLSFNIKGKDYAQNEMDPKEFYRLLRAGENSITAQVNVEQMNRFFEPILEQGNDILYIAFSSGLSGTYNSGMVAAQMLAEKYPDRKIFVVDTLAASLGQGLFVYMVNEQKKQGKSIEEIVSWAEENKLCFVHCFTVDDLMHLHRGGRVSKASAIIGSVLGIKPMLHVDDEGKLIMIGKVRGRKQSLVELVNMMEKQVGDYKNNIFFISHGDCEEDAQYVAKLAQERFGIKDYVINTVGPVIGSHSGPGTVAFFMMAQHR